MIIKGGSRGGPEQLARHLQRRDTNEKVDILEMAWSGNDLNQTLREWQILSEGTRGTKGLYHVNIDPAEEYRMTPEQWKRSVDVLEKELGFDGQPRLVVMHQKHGREHIHVVWARTDIDTMTLRSDSMNYLAHERASKALELEFGHELVPGKHDKRDREKQEEFPRAEMSQAEWQQAERTGVTVAERRAQITALKEASDGAQAFKAALEEQGYILAKGDRRGFVLVDGEGEVYSLSRQLKDLKPAEFRAFMKPIDRESLPSVSEAVEIQEQKKQEKAQDSPEQPDHAKNEQSAAQQEPSNKPLSQEEIQAIEKAVAERQAKEAADMRGRHDVEHERTRKILDDDISERLEHLDATQRAERDRFERQNAPPEGFEKLVDTVQRWWNPKEAEERDAAVQRQREQLEQRQTKDRLEYQTRLQELRDVELDNLTERHAQQARDHATKTGEDLERYIKEREEERRIRAEVEELEKQREQERAREGPDPPERAR